MTNKEGFEDRPSNGQPQDIISGLGENTPNDVLEGLVKSLAKQVQAAEERSEALAARVASLERDNAKSNGDDDAYPIVSAVFEEPTKKNLSDPQDGKGNRRESQVRFSEDIVQRYDVEEPLSERVTLLEERLADMEESKDRSLRTLLDDKRNQLPESTFTFFITEHPLSLPFLFALFSTVLSTMCLGLSLKESIDSGRSKNRLGVPVGVSDTVRAAQFLGAMVGVLMEDEVPQGLQLIANAVGHKMLLDGTKMVHMRVILSSILRLAVGYLFLSSMFLNIVQNDDVLSIFYDVLALEFVENIDDTAFALAKRGFFGEKMTIATNKEHTLELIRKSQARGGPQQMERTISKVGFISSNSWTNRFVRCVYFLNAFVIIGGLAYITVSQKQGDYRCKTFTVTFDEEIWENAPARLHQDDEFKERLLIYSYFNGIYKETDQIGEGYPLYTEQNKNNGEEFVNTVGAEIRYCEDIESWVFTHPDIATSLDDNEENECNWLLRSSQTEDYDILSVSSSPWDVWAGEVKHGSMVTVTCNECEDRSDCNYHGSCENQVCKCDDNRFGDHCEFELPCQHLASEKAEKDDGEGWQHETPIELMEIDDESGRNWVKVYNRPVYIQKNLGGSEPFDFRKYDIREVDKTPSSSPSSNPTSVSTPVDTPTVGTNTTLSPTPLNRRPTQYPTEEPAEEGIPPGVIFGEPDSSVIPTSSPSVGGHIKSSESPTDIIFADPVSLYPPTFFPTLRPSSLPPTPKPTSWHKQNTYEENIPDFADWDDFFEAQGVHDLEELIEHYSVILSFSGTRWYGTMIDPFVSFENIFHSDYHGFWDSAFSINRTFIISEITFEGAPTGIDFFEMRRRINSIFNPNIHFAYGPFGALIPLMNYDGAGFFHCLDEPSLESQSAQNATV